MKLQAATTTTQTPLNYMQPESGEPNEADEPFILDTSQDGWVGTALSIGGGGFSRGWRIKSEPTCYSRRKPRYSHRHRADRAAGQSPGKRGHLRCDRVHGRWGADGHNSYAAGCAGTDAQA